MRATKAWVDPSWPSTVRMFSLAPVGFFASRSTTSRPSTDNRSARPKAAPVAAAPSGFGYGIQVHAPGGDQRSIDAVKDLGFNWVKQQVEWHRHEGAPGQYDFGGLDTLVNQANAAGITRRLQIGTATRFASTPSCVLLWKW